MKKRIIGIIIMIIVFVPVIIYGRNVFKLAVSILGLLALKELLGLKELKRKTPSFVKFLSYISTLFLILSKFNVDNYSLFLDYRIIAIMIIFFLIPLIIYNDFDKYNIIDALFILGIVLMIGFVFNLLIFIREYDIKTFIYILSISTMTDSYALISGMLSGRKKLCPKISPKKSIVGLVVGVLCGTLIASTIYYITINDSVNLFALISITMFLSLISQLGDLIFSSIKRFYNVKDYSNIIFGHGGILDRFDSLIFVLIGYIFFISII
ncbi:MAG: phosphatidate cytidylyltransferase [Bacilli bacterium]|nr:phosphatidate cytidylyltransferase [Bacilli bacterium]